MAGSLIRRAVIPGLLLVAGYYAVFGGGYSVLDLNRIHTETRAAEARLAELHEETAALEERADALENDPRTLERIARERFGLIRDGEVLYRFADGPDSTVSEVDRSGSRR